MSKKFEIIFQLIENPPSISSSSTSSYESDEPGSSSETSGTSSSSDEDTDLLFFPLMKYLIGGRKRCRIENYIQLVDSMTDAEYKEHFRLTRLTSIQLTDELKLSGVLPTHFFGINPIAAKLSFHIFLWYMANTEPLRTISDRFDVSISSVFRVIRRVIAWLLLKLNEVIQWPQGDEIDKVCHRFRAKRGIRNILGAIDGTHIQIEKPALNGRDYCNRKKFFSISLQAVVDSDLRFTNVHAGEPGSLHDSRVLRRSPLFQAATENKEILFSQETFIIGDSAYASLSWLVPPFRDNGHLTAQQTEFNYLHSSTRMAVEKAFGCLKGRFRRVKFFTEYRELSFITNTVIAAYILHNYCIDARDMYEFPEYVDDHVDGMNDHGLDEVHCRMQMDRRMQLFTQKFPGHRI